MNKGMPYKVDLIKSWDELDQYSTSWNKLWSQTDCIREELYDYFIIKHIVQYKEKMNGNPFVFIIKNKFDDIQTILPFYQRNRKYKKLKFNSLTFFPTFITIRHSPFMGENLMFAPEVFKRIQELLHYEKIDIIDMKGIPDRIDDVFRSEYIQQIPKTKIFHPSFLPGSRSSDLLAIKISDSFEEYLRNRKTKVRSNIRRLLKNAPEYSIQVYNRFNNVNPNVNYILDCIKEIETNAWQKVNNDNHFTYHSNMFCLDFLNEIVDLKIHDIYILTIDSKPVSFYLGSLIQNRANCHFVAYNKNFKNISPGSLLLINVVKDKILNNRVDLINLYGASGRDLLYKSQLGELKDLSFDYFSYLMTPKAQIANCLFSLIAILRKTLK